MALTGATLTLCATTLVNAANETVTKPVDSGMMSSAMGHKGMKAVSSEHIISSIKTAEAAYPGMIKEVEVDRKNGKLAVEVKIIATDGKEKKIMVDPDTNKVIP